MSNNYQELYEKTTIPYWADHCGHGGYLFSFTSYAFGEEPAEIIDVYCWDNNGRQEFCLRFGDRSSDYRSPGGIERIIYLATSGFGPYPACMELLRMVGAVRFCVLNPDRIPQGAPHSEERKKQLEDLKSGRIGSSMYKEAE